MALRFRAVSASSLGNRENNEDRSLVTDRILAVADGMGGQAGGEVAAQLAIDTLAQHAQSGDLTSLVEAVRTAHREILHSAEQERELEGMGTTLVAIALLDDGTLGVANVGDSRAYLLRAGELSRLTEDHNFAQELVRRGEMTAERATVDPFRNLLSRVLGVERPDAGPLEVDTVLLATEGTDRLLLSSDGLTNEVLDEEILEVLRANPDDEAAAAALVDRAIAQGGRDNVTVVLGRLVDAAAH